MLSFQRAFPNGRCVIIVPTLALLDQWYVSLREDLAVPDQQIGTYSGEGRPAQPAQVNIMVVNTARSIASTIASKFETFLIVDECHRSASPSNSLGLQGHHQATLGLSATPKRDYDSGLEDTLIPALGDVIFTYDYNEALRDGVISPFELVNVSIGLTPNERSEYDALSRRVAILLARLRKGELVEENLKRLLRSRAAVAATATMRIPTTLRLVEENRGARTIIFHERVQAAEEIKTLLSERRINATIYHSRISPVVRRDNLRLFRRGAFDVIVTCRALDEGTNVPETTVAIIASSTASTRQRIQRLGRVLRPAPGKSRATIFTIFATDVEKKRLIREALALPEADSVSWRRATVKANA